MSSKVDLFLSESGGNNFTETAPRPPVPGEENEKESNGGMSTKSSASSHKSHVSHTSGRSNSSNKGDINPATPRKSNIDKNNASMSCSLQGCDDEMDAPLGFEPEGSATNSPPFTENSTPPCSRWAKSLHVLLDDRDGISLFRTFLEQEGIGTFSLDFWFLCRGLKLKDSEDDNSQVIKAIYRKYIKSDKLPYLGSDTKKNIVDQMQSGMDLSIFNAAQEEVEQYMANDAYPAFLKSDLYIQYFARGGDSSNSSSGSNSARPVSSGPLPTLREDHELEHGDFVQPLNMGPPLSKSFTRTPINDSRRQEVFSGPHSYNPRPLPYHISYAPTSAQDSELQSLSSTDALTDDTRSLTDSSVDGHSYRESRRQKKILKQMQRRAGQNRELGPHIPRTDRAPKDRTLAEVDPKKFAELLIEKLEIVFRQQENDERVHKMMSQSDVSESFMDKSCVSSISSRNNTATSIVPLLTSSMIDEENADSILEEHCSRIWERSAQQTPSRSPGRHSPRSRSPDRYRKQLSQAQAHTGTSSMPGTLHTKPLNSKKRSEFYSSFDSGMGEDNNKCSVETHKHIHHHHHHHHEKSGRRSKHKLELQAQQHSIYCWGDPPPRPHGGARQKPMSRSHSDNCSNLDSGISMIESVSQYPEVNTSDPANTKVLQWILDNENMNRGTSSAYTDSDKTSSTHKRSHKSSALNAGSQPYNKNCSKKGSGSHINRSASADSGSRVPWVPPGGGMSVLPNQPIVQDPSMPLMPPPNTRVQLEEVTRRLETDHTLKSKSFTGTIKEKRPNMPIGQGRVPGMPMARTVPADLDTSGDSSRIEKQMKKSTGSMNTSTSSKPDETVIGYYMCGEPIPYRITVSQPHVTLGQLKQLISKRGNFRYFVKTHSRDFDSEVVYEEIKEDVKILPVFDGKVVVKIDKIDDMDSPNKSNSSKR